MWSGIGSSCGPRADKDTNEALDSFAQASLACPRRRKGLRRAMDPGGIDSRRSGARCHRHRAELTRVRERARVAIAQEKWRMCVKNCVPGVKPTTPYNTPSNAIQRHYIRLPRKDATWHFSRFDTMAEFL